jgi:hypothetical protein
VEHSIFRFLLLFREDVQGIGSMSIPTG